MFVHRRERANRSIGLAARLRSEAIAVRGENNVIRKGRVARRARVRIGESIPVVRHRQLERINLTPFRMPHDAATNGTPTLIDRRSVIVRFTVKSTACCMLTT